LPSLKLAIHLPSLRLPLKRALRVAAELGVAAVEIDARGEINPQEVTATGLRQIRKMFDDYQLRVSAVEFHTRRGYDVQDDLVRRVEATKAAMKMAHGLGASLVINQIGRVPEDDQSPAWRLLTDVLADLGRYGQHCGALLAAETGSESGPQLQKLVAALPPGSLAVTLNPGKLLINGFPPLDAIAALGDDIRYVHVQDGVQDRATGRGTEVVLGRGSADFPALLGALEERGYQGYFCIVREQSSDPVTEISQAVQYLRSL
jgi:sugar phosphate isomerase/epimerase